MPDKVKKPRRSKAEALADRVFKHYKSIKRTWDREWVKTHDCESCAWSTHPHMHGYYKMSTPNADWLRLAREHKLSVREVKDIVTARRNWDREEAIKRHESRADMAERMNTFIITGINDDSL